MKQKVLIVEDNISLSQRQKDWLEQAGDDVMTAMREPAARALIRKHRFDFILSDVRLPEGDGISLLEWLTKEKKDIPFIVTTEYGSIPDAVRAIKLGAKDYLPKPVHREHLLELAEEIFCPLATVRTKPKDLFRRTCPKILEVERYARIVAPSDMSVLILGANGTGKESVAQGIHANSGRDGKFVAVNCGALPRELAASLLFGHEKGAFTDARKAKAGRMEVATGGTLFLDEIGNLSLPMQAKLLTAIEKRCISRLGSTQATPIDVRLICATNADIRRLVDEGDFRQDLLYRINTIELHIPPLRERGNDILLLAEYFLQRYARKYQKEMRGLTREAKNKLLKYAWPGNVRELQHTVERAVILGDGSLLRPENFMFQASVSRQKKEEEVLNLEQLERQAVERAMRLSEGNVTRAAEYLGITRFALYRKLEKLGL